MIKRILFFSALITLMLLSACSGNTALSYQFQQGSCPDGVSQAPYCMAVQVSNNAGGGQTWITNSSYPVSGLSISTSGATNIQTPSTSQSTMDPNNCTGTTLAPGANCTFYIKINFESYPTNSMEAVNVTLNYSLNNNLFGSSTSSGSSSFTVYEFTNLYAAQSNGWVGIYNIGGNMNVLAESINDPINTSATDTSSYGLLYLGGNNGIYTLGNESGVESTSTLSLPSGYSGSTNNLFTFSSSLYTISNAGSQASVWNYTFSTQSWASAATFTLNAAVQPNANAISQSGILYIATKNQVFTCTSGTTNCTNDGVSTGSSGGGPTTINAIAFPNSGSAPFTGFYIGGVNGLFAESGTLPSSLNGNANNTWIQVYESSSSGTSTPLNNTINAMTTYTATGNLYAADNNGNIWLIPNSYTGTTKPPTASLVANVGAPITAITMDNIGGILYFATTSGNSSTLYGCNISATPSSCTPQSSNTNLYPVVSLSIASQLIAP